MSAVLSAGEKAGNHEDAEYDAYLGRLNARFAAAATRHGALFTTDAQELWPAYLTSFPLGERQYHNCNTCRHFIERFGGVVFIGEDGLTTPAMWDDAEANLDCAAAVRALKDIVRRAKVTGVFYSSDKTLGQPVTGVWHHLSVRLPAEMIHKHPLLTASQYMAEKREDYNTMQRAVGEFTAAQVDQALQLLNSDALYRSEKVIGPAQFLRDLIAIREGTPRDDVRRNLTWRRIAAAPAGFCHPRSSMIGTLLEDIAASLDFSYVSRKFAAKMHPLQYQRPQAAPSAGAIAAAEAAFAKLGAAGALSRRLACVGELQALWKPKAEEKSTEGGIFGHLKAKGAEPTPASLRVPAMHMTWDKFNRTVLPTAERIEVLVPSHAGNWCVFVTAADQTAPPILQWDRDDARNPVSWYVWNGGAPASQYGLGAGYHDVEAIVFKPSMWFASGAFSHQGQSATFIVRGARETRQAGAALFPEILRSEFHGMRSVIEAYSRGAQMGGLDQPHAAGLQINAGSTSPISVRVHGGPSPMEYLLDRWD